MATNIVPVGGERQVNFVDPLLSSQSGVAGSQDNAQIVALPNGNFIVVYESLLNAGGGPDGNFFGLLWQEFTPSGVQVGDPHHLDLDDAPSDPALAARADGGFVAVWHELNDVKLALVGPGATTEPAEFLIADGLGSSFERPSVATLANGSYFVAMVSEPNNPATPNAIFAALVPPEGANSPDLFRVDSGASVDSGPAVVAASGNNAVVAWREGPADDGSLKLKLFGSTGTLLDAETVVEDASGINTYDVTTLEDGRVVVVWESTGSNLVDIFARIYNPASGKFSTDALTISSRIGDQFEPSVAALPDGGFIVTWTDLSGQFGDLSGTAINARRFEASGAPAGDEFRLNTGTNSGQIESDVAVNAAGRVFGVWTNIGSENTTDTSPTGLQGQAGKVATEVVNDVPGAHFISTYNLSETINGLDGNDIIRSFGGNDTLNGGGGADLMEGGAGNDTYVVDGGGDIVDERGSSGTDTVRSSVSLSLSNAGHFKGAIENLTLVGGTNLNAAGNGLANTLIGNVAANVLNGAGGNDIVNGAAGEDRVLGGAGNDVLLGGAGGDVLIGGLGQDDLNGGAAADRFDFNAAVETPRGANRDIILDFSRAQGDKIDIATIDADTSANPGNDLFTFIAGQAFHGGGGEVRFAGGILQGDINGDRVADFEIRVIGASSLVGGDLIL